MLILARRCGQSIMIGDDVEVFVVDIGEGKVRLGIAGPGHVAIHKRERYHQHGPRQLVEAHARPSPSRLACRTDPL